LVALTTLTGATGAGEAETGEAETGEAETEAVVAEAPVLVVLAIGVFVYTLHIDVFLSRFTN
jgi:hypothetical protein